MPLALNEDQPARDFDLPLSVRLRADAKGQLAGIEIGEQRLANPDALRAMLEHHSATNRAAEPTLDVDLVCDEHLRYEHVMAALTAVSGKRVGDEIIRLARDVRISSPR
jgi:hypothetical protein